MENNLFGKNADARTWKKDAPLSVYLLPEKIDDIAGQRHILSPDKLLYRLVVSDTLRSAIIYGPPGTGKTALAKIVAKKTNALTYEINAAIAGTGELKKIIKETDILKQSYKKDRVLLMLDEIHHFNRSQQDVLLPSVEKGEIILIGITTENPYFYINKALLSRFAVFEFKSLTDGDLEKILASALNRLKKETSYPSVCFEEKAKKHLIARCGGDGRKLINALELAVLTVKPQKGKIRVTLPVAEELVQKRSISYDKSADEHYDHISAFIKSMRGSDPDAAVYWLAKMIAAGEDPRFIARRILICASEDVGNADPVALIIAQNAFNAVEMLGMPESRIILSQAAIYVACAPKSNASYKAIDTALAEVEKGVLRKVPGNLKSGGRNKDYVYPHDYPGHYVKQQYMPNPKKFYKPSTQGKEALIKQKLEKLEKIKK
jgi:putative ATPase